MYFLSITVNTRWNQHNLPCLLLGLRRTGSNKQVCIELKRIKAGMVLTFVLSQCFIVKLLTKPILLRINIQLTETQNDN